MAHVSPSAVVSAAALNKRAKKITEAVFKEGPVFAMVKQKGRMEYNCGGLAIEWPVRYRRRSIVAGGSPLAVSFPEFNRLMKAEAPYRVYELGEGISKYSQMATRNDPNSYIDAYDKMMQWGLDDFNKDLAKKVYTDGAATGSKEMWGFEALLTLLR